jgi:hypothetical protein
MVNPSKALILLISLFWLSACAATLEPEATPEQQPALTPDPVAEEPATLEPEPEIVVPETPALVASDIIGMEPVEVQNLLGPVSLKRWEGEVQVMQFANEHCVIDIYFYEISPGEAFEASYLNARTSSGSGVGSDICLASLLPGGVWAGDPVETSPVGQ